MKTKTCCLCKKKFKGYGNNAIPIKEGICCDECNTTKVIPSRLEQMIIAKKGGKI